MQNPVCQRSLVWGSSGSHQITASGASANKYPSPGSQQAVASGQGQTYGQPHPSLARNTIEGQLFQVGPISSTASRARNDHRRRVSDLCGAVVWSRGRPSSRLHPDRERSREEERENLGTGHGAACARKKEIPKATLHIASARRLLQEQLPSSSARLLACEARQ